MSKKSGSEVVEAVAPKSVVNQLMGLYVIIAFTLALSWLLGSMSCSFLWIFGLIFGLFIMWKSRLRELVERTVDLHTQHQNRKRALRQEETAEWLNFIVNRWWVFCSVSIEDLVKRRINDRLYSIKPPFIGHLELSSFTFGDATPSIRCIKAYECLDGVRGFKPASWSNVTLPPAGLEKMSTFQIVLEADTSSRCEDFRMVFRARAGGEKVGLNFDIAVEELRIKGRLQIVLHLSMELPFPHITKATVSFTDQPEVWFNVTLLKALHLMEVPLLKSWIHVNVMEGITQALVDPGKLDIPIAKVGPVNALQLETQSKPNLAQGVLTIELKGTPSVNADEEIHYTQLKVGKCKRQTAELPAASSWEDCCSFFIHDLCKEKLKIKLKCKRLLTTVTIQQHDLELSSFPFNINKQIPLDIDNQNGSKLSLRMDYSPLSPINLLEEEPVSILHRSGVLYVCVHCAVNVLGMDKSGSSDPYCVAFCDRRRVMTTPYIAQNRNPSWQSQTEFFVKDFSQCQLSFYVFDWDGTNTLDDDFLGSAMYAMTEDKPCVLNKALDLGYNKQSDGHVTDLSLGQIYVSIIFRPVPSVLKSERYRLTSTDSMNNNNNEFLYIEDMVSPGTMSIIDHVQRSGESSEMVKAGSRRMSKKHALSVRDQDLMKDRLFVDLCILQAKELIAMDRNGFSDPFCVVKRDDKKLFSTSVKKKTLSPKWNETVTFQVTEDGGMLEIELYDKDIMINDFLGKVSLTLDQLKEISLKGSSEWFQLQHVRSGQLQISCAVTAPDTLKKESRKADSSSANLQHDQSRRTPVRSVSNDSDVFISPTNSKVTKSVLPLKESNNGQLPARQTSAETDLPDTSTPLKDNHALPPVQESPIPSSLKRSASDVNLGRRPSQTNSLNSISAFHDLDVSTVVKSAKESEKSPGTEDGNGKHLFNVTGKVLSVHGLKFNEGTIYCKVRVISPHKHRLRKIFGNRVIAKSSMIKASQPTMNLPIDVDRGMGVNGETLLKFDIKREGKEHLASKAYSLQSLFSGPGGEADKIQKVLPLENNLQVELYLQHSPLEASSFLRRRHGSRMSGISRSVRKSNV